MFTNVFNLQLFTSYRKHVAKYFKNSYLKSLLEFPVLFLGTAPSQTPALYSLMTYSGIKKGTFYPMGGFGKVIDAFKEICSEQGVEFHTNEAVQSVNIEEKTIQLSGPNHNILVFVLDEDFKEDGRFKLSTLIFEMSYLEFLNLKSMP